MKAQIFVDSGAWLALADNSDGLHLAAVGAYTTILQSGHHLVTTNLVVAETYNLVRQRLGYGAALRFLRSLTLSPRVHKIYSEEALEREAEQILLHFNDQDFSYVDAVSFSLMHQRKIEEAFAFDHHFLVAGFSLVPAPR